MHTRAIMHTHKHTHKHARTHKHTHRHTNKDTQTDRQTDRHTHTHTHTRTHTHTNTHIHIHIHKHTRTQVGDAEKFTQALRFENLDSCFRVSKQGAYFTTIVVGRDDTRLAQLELATRR